LNCSEKEKWKCYLLLILQLAYDCPLTLKMICTFRATDTSHYLLRRCIKNFPKYVIELLDYFTHPHFGGVQIIDLRIISTALNTDPLERSNGPQISNYYLYEHIFDMQLSSSSRLYHALVSCSQMLATADRCIYIKYKRPCVLVRMRLEHFDGQNLDIEFRVRRRRYHTCQYYYMTVFERAIRITVARKLANISYRKIKQC